MDINVQIWIVKCCSDMATFYSIYGCNHCLDMDTVYLRHGWITFTAMALRDI